MRLLLVEDKDSFRRMLEKAIPPSLWETVSLADPLEALTHLERDPFDVLLTDLRLPGISGLDLLRRARRIRPQLRCVLMSAFGEPRDIVEAIRSGADEFLPKPFDLDQLLGILERLRGLMAAPPPDPREAWVAQSPASKEWASGLLRASEHRLPVLLCGEPGVGRARGARRIHTLGQPGTPYLVRQAWELDPCRLEEDLLLARGGTLFLPDLDRMGDPDASNLIRAMDGPAGSGLRWIASSRHPAGLQGPLGTRFGALRFYLPPLRDRREDILPLLMTFLQAQAKAEGRPLPILDRAAEQEALDHSWPGNAEELAACAAASLRATEGLRIRRLTFPGSGSQMVLPWPADGDLEGMLKSVRAQAEAALLRRALDSAGGDLGAAAHALGLTLRVLGQRLRENGIDLES
ncbi:MAG: sigma-54-dependent Fis family transcriptional regulator [Acidobacteria bacterium]|nr:sigma-54-dependent Fis family transcriptional regulator [Acidobacteriota bacterium]